MAGPAAVRSAERSAVPSPGRRWTALLVTERQRPECIRIRPGGWWLAVATVCFGAFMGQLDASIVTLTYDSLRAQFGAPLAAVEWVSLAYLLALVALLIPAGRLSDAHGRKLFYLYGFVVFTAASAACGLAPSLAALVVFRVVQACGAAMMQANSVALVTTSAPREKMRAALGVQAAAQALGLALGPTVGGALVSTLGWRWVFGINVPIGAVALLAGHYLLPRTRHRCPARRFDWAGLVLLAAATTSLLLAVSAASGLPVAGWVVAVLLTVAAGATWAFADRQRRIRHPLLDLRMLRIRAVSTGLFAALCGYLVLFGPLVLVPIIVMLHGHTTLTAGSVLTALPAGFALAAVGADRIMPSGMSDRARCVTGAVLCSGALAALLASSLSIPWLTPLLALLGLGLGLFTPANNALIMGAIPADSSGTGGGLVNMARGLGTALGVALAALTLYLGGPYGHRWALFTLLLISLLAAVAAWLGPGGRPPAMDSGPAPRGPVRAAAEADGDR
ncbi:MFS transporter [Streptomyces sp. NPDC052396]|uniref:MFS transporter n=1 Tax=Streptomyces sp. NPDC052396 TaxID=3365689 RepID=UPI0037D21F73